MSIDKSLYEAINKMESGKEEGFNVIYTRTYDFVYRRAKFMLKNEEDALDLVQETYIQAYKGISTLEDANNLYGWLGAITFRQGTKIIRKKKDVLLDEESEFIFEELENEDMDFEPGAKAEYRAIAEVVQQFIEELPELQKAAIMAYYYDNMKIDDIATAFECTPSTIKSRLNYAKNHIRERVTSHEKKYQYALHSVSPAILFFAIEDVLAKESYKLQTAMVQTTYANICKNVGLQIGQVAKTAVIKTAATDITGVVVKRAGLSLSKKIALAVTIPLLVIGGTIATMNVTEHFVKEAGPLGEREDSNPDGENVVDGEELEWVQAYKEFLYDEEKIKEALTEKEYNEDRECDVWSGDLSGFYLHDMNEDGIPELFLRKTGDRKANKIYIYSYAEGEVHCGGTVGIENAGHRGDYNGESIGYDKETNQVFYYAEVTSSMEYWIKIQGLSFDEWGLFYDFETGGCISEVEYEENPDWVWPTDRESLWEAVYEKDSNIDESTKEYLYNYIPFVWQDYSEEMIESYVSADYQTINLGIKDEIEDNVHEYFFVYPECENYEEILKERKPEELEVTDQNGEPYYFDSKTMSAFLLSDALDVKEFNLSNIRVYAWSTEEYVNFRMGPSAKYNTIFRIDNEQELQVLYMSEDEKWYGLWYEGEFGWVPSSETDIENDYISYYEFTKEEEMKIRRLLGVPDELENIDVVDYDWEYSGNYNCEVIWVEIYHDGNYVAGGCFSEELEGLLLNEYTPVE